ncbi:DNA metabolism protein [Flavobacterium aquidurense]|uniref:TIGR03915 family putative DNA repair protein n=1 Tax=Flavobacterium aquidurense TaxID=362413 RepID=UPI00091026AC|nr:TIGR03915 family putative DNA repair protein [Flavobacterium aquidurense]OXA71082.1 DNA metabolism protein [Flavobacterium aquidurense]SHG63550.1 probable DNA metabolism protein [Flavobacterium frigidimaris]
MTQIIYDGTYEGWVTAVFEIYEYKLKDIVFAQNEASADLLFSTNHIVITDEVKVKRVLSGLQKRLSKNGFQGLYNAFLSETNKVEEIMFRYIQYVLLSPVNVEDDFGNNDVLELRKAIRLTGKEAHRMEAFVRFQLTKDQLYYAIVEPDCNVLPLIENHFKSRYADQRWLIYDAKRKYGIYYDLKSVSTVALQFNTETNSSKFLAEISDEGEELFQDLWRNYFKSVNIESRKNTKLHLQHMPKRYWKNLTEKIPDIKGRV